jgi:GH43 family beta-xylosidase
MTSPGMDAPMAGVRATRTEARTMSTTLQGERPARAAEAADLRRAFDFDGDRRTFTNPIYPGADPWVVRHGDDYYLCRTGRGGRIEVCVSDSLTRAGRPHVVWVPPPAGRNSAEVWAPELHRLGTRWYIYYAASDGRNANHRMYVLQSTHDDPLGPYVERGALYTGDDVAGGRDNRWAIDGTVLPLGGHLYFLWSGWEATTDVQHLYVARMANPWTIGTDRVRMCGNDDHLWERVGDRAEGRGLNEGPVVLVRKGRVFVVYSASGSWQSTYKMGMLVADASVDLLTPGIWRKLARPVFESTADVFGVGHCSFTTSPDGTEDWMLYHAKRQRREGWDREVRAQQFTWDADGMPVFGAPIDSSKVMRAPSGERAAPATRPATAA